MKSDSLLAEVGFIDEDVVLGWQFEHYFASLTGYFGSITNTSFFGIKKTEAFLGIRHTFWG